MKTNIDISKQKAKMPSPIEEVGLSGVELPLKMKQGQRAEKTLAQADVFVSLDDPSMRGIHMSRLYLSLYDFSLKKTLTLSNLKNLLKTCIASQKGLASRGRIFVSFKSSLKKKALKSPHFGSHTYPCFYSVKKDQKGFEAWAGARFYYSSTCPCSAALSRVLIQEKFKKNPPKNLSKKEILNWLGLEGSIAGTPHSQRSEACFKVRIKKEVDLLSLIHGMEKALGTPVQSAVKREDEKAFAALNSQNLMYSEDAVRKLKKYLSSKKEIEKYQIQVRHIESLHPFDTAALIQNF